MQNANENGATTHIRVIHIASLGMTLERFVEPLSIQSDNQEFEHLYVHANSIGSNSESALEMSFGRTRIGIIRAWLKSKENGKRLLAARPNIIHIHTPATAFALVLSLRRVKSHGIKVVYTARGSLDEGGNLARKVVWYLLDPLKWRVWDGVCVVNDHLFQVAEAVPHRILRKVSIGSALPNYNVMIPIDNFSPDSEETNALRLVWVGRLDKDKRLQDFINLVIALGESLPSGCVGEVIGASLEGDVGRVSIPTSGNIVYHGWVNSPSSIVSRCDILISTSIREGYGLAPLEAALVGTPTIAVANHGTRESVLAVGGILLNPNGSDQLLEAVHEYAGRTPEWRAMNRLRVQGLARKLIENSNPTAEMFEFYSRIV